MKLWKGEERLRLTKQRNRIVSLVMQWLSIEQILFAKALDRMRGKGMVGNSVVLKRTDMRSDGKAGRWFASCSKGID